VLDDPYRMRRPRPVAWTRDGRRGRIRGPSCRPGS